MKRARTDLPEGYKEIFTVNLQKDKKMVWLINIASLLICAAMIVPVHFIVPIQTIFDMSKGVAMYFIRCGVILAAMVLYMVLHELVHGITMKYFGTKKVKYGFTGLYAFAGSDDYYDKKSYIIIALAPVIVWGVVLLVLNFLVGESWFWAVYIIQVLNISGAVGDVYVTVKFSRMPSDILVHDIGVGMAVYSAQ